MKKITSTFLEPSFLKLGLKLSFAICLALFLVDFYTYAGAIKNNLFLSPLAITGIVLVMHIIVRQRWKVILETGFTKALLLYVAPFLLFLNIVARFLEEYGFLFPNYFFINFGLHYAALPALVAGLVGFGLVHMSRDFIVNYGKEFYFLLMFWLIIGAAVLFLEEPLRWREYTREDNLVEYLTFIGFIVAGVVSLLMTRYKALFAESKKLQDIFKVICIMVGVGFLVIAGEEISWAQRIIGIETPAVIAEQNKQEEINLHNLDTFWPYVYHGYQKLAFYGLVSGFLVWIIKDRLPRKTTLRAWIKLLAPDPYLALNFLLIMTYVWLRHRHGPWKYSKWEEFSELILVIGIATHLVQRFLEFRQLAAANGKAKKN